VIEHDPDLIKYADWIIDLGPGGGKEGGSLLYEGAPAGFASCADSVTAPYIAPYWKA
jgi:excinuclease ABC subunit A